MSRIPAQRSGTVFVSSTGKAATGKRDTADAKVHGRSSGRRFVPLIKIENEIDTTGFHRISPFFSRSCPIVAPSNGLGT